MTYSFEGDEMPPNNPRLNEHFTEHMSHLLAEEIERIRAYGDANLTRSRQHLESHVKVKHSRLDICAETLWIYERMAELTKSINNQDYHYDLNGFGEKFYYLSYGEGEHFNWHVDQDGKTPHARKLSLVLNLSRPDEYDGGELQIMAAGDPLRPLNLQGLVTAFPSHKIHRVTPITRGARRTVAMFASGPNFR